MNCKDNFDQDIMTPKEKTVTSIVLKRFHCTKQNREFIPKQHYISSLERYEEIIKKDKYLKLIKLE